MEKLLHKYLNVIMVSCIISSSLVQYHKYKEESLMAFKNAYLASVMETVKKRNGNEPEFIQAVQEVLESFEPVVEQRPDLIEKGVIDRIVEPERFVQFRVPWVDDSG